jgi:hypothetical protein
MDRWHLHTNVSLSLLSELSFSVLDVCFWVVPSLHPLSLVSHTSTHNTHRRLIGLEWSRMFVANASLAMSVGGWQVIQQRTSPVKPQNHKVVGRYIGADNSTSCSATEVSFLSLIDVSCYARIVVSHISCVVSLSYVKYVYRIYGRR